MTAPDVIRHHGPVAETDPKAPPGPSWPDTAFGYFALTVYGTAMITPLRMLRGAGPQQVGESEPVVAACQYLILTVLLYVILKRRDRIIPLIRLIKPYVLVVCLCIASVLWSDYPLATLRRSSTLGVCVMFGVYCYDTFGLNRLIRMISNLAICLALLSLVAYITMPEIGREPTVEVYSNAMRGVFAQKNGMAQNMLLGIACLSYQLIQTKRWITFLLILLLFFCIILARSMSSLLVATVVLTASGWMMLRGMPRARLALVFVASSIYAVLLVGLCVLPGEVFQFLGRDESLTGRLPLWQLIVAAIADRPLLGYGYSGFWNADSRDVQYLWLRAGWPAPDSHNGYLDIMLQTGIVGILVYGWLWASIIRPALKAWRSGTLPVSAWILLFMLISILVNLDEGPLPWADNFTAAGVPALISLVVWNKRQREATNAARSGKARVDRSLSRAITPVRTAGRFEPQVQTNFTRCST